MNFSSPSRGCRCGGMEKANSQSKAARGVGSGRLSGAAPRAGAPSPKAGRAEPPRGTRGGSEPVLLGRG